MSVTVTLYKGISPNHGKHYKFFSSYPDYISSLGDYYKRYTLSDDRISDSQLIFSAAENVDAAEVSYCYINRNDGTGNQKYYFYHVRNGSVRSGMAFLELELDIWATYLLQVKFGEIYVERCNRAIFANGLYDDFGVTNGVPVYSEIGNFTAKNSNLLLCYVMSYTNPAGLLQTSGVTVQMYGNLLNSVTSDGSTQTRDITDIIAAIGSISSVRWSPGTSGTVTQGEVLSCFLVPVDMVEKANAGDLPEFISTHGNTSEVIRPQYKIKPGIKSKDLTIPSTPRYIQYLGTRVSKLKVPQCIGNIDAQYQFITGVDNISVYVNIGDIRYNLSDDFVMPIIKNQNENNQAYLLKNGLNGISQALSLTLTGNAGAGVGAVGGFLGNMVDLARGQAPNFQISDGAAMAAFYHGDNVNFYSPYTLSRFEPIQLPIRNIRNNGAIFNVIYSDSLATVFDASLLGIGPPSSTYIQGVIDCYGAQADILDFFIQRFREGVYLEKI